MADKNKYSKKKHYKKYSKEKTEKSFSDTSAEKSKVEAIRLNKYLANAGICSRRDADELIKEGLVKVNGKVVIMSVKPFIIDGRTVVPLRFISEALGATVEWIGETKSIKIYYPINPNIG